MSNIRDRIIMNKKPIIIGVVITSALIVTTSLIIYFTWPEIEDVNNNVVKAADKFKENAGLSRIRGKDTNIIGSNPVVDKVDDTNKVDRNLLMKLAKSCVYTPNSHASDKYTVSKIELKWITHNIATNNNANSNAHNDFPKAIYIDLFDTKKLRNYKDMIRLPFNLNGNWSEIIHPMRISYYFDQHDQTFLKIYSIEAQNYTFGYSIFNNLQVDNTEGEEAMTIVLLLKAQFLHLKLYFMGENGCRNLEYKMAVSEDYNLEIQPIGNFELVNNDTLETSLVGYGMTLDVENMYNNPLFVEIMDRKSKFLRTPWPFNIARIVAIDTADELKDTQIVEFIDLIDIDLETYTIFGIYDRINASRNFIGYRKKINNDSTEINKNYLVEKEYLDNIIPVSIKNLPFGGTVLSHMLPAELQAGLPTKDDE